MCTVLNYFCIFCKFTNIDFNFTFNHYKHHIFLQNNCEVCKNISFLYSNQSVKECDHSVTNLSQEEVRVNIKNIEEWIYSFLSYQTKILNKNFDNLFLLNKVCKECVVCHCLVNSFRKDINVCDINQIQYINDNIKKHCFKHLKYNSDLYKIQKLDNLLEKCFENSISVNNIYFNIPLTNYCTPLTNNEENLSETLMIKNCETSSLIQKLPSPCLLRKSKITVKEKNNINNNETFNEKNLESRTNGKMILDNEDNDNNKFKVFLSEIKELTTTQQCIIPNFESFIKLKNYGDINDFNKHKDIKEDINYLETIGITKYPIYYIWSHKNKVPYIKKISYFCSGKLKNKFYKCYSCDYRGKHKIDIKKHIEYIKKQIKDEHNPSNRSVKENSLCHILLNKRYMKYNETIPNTNKQNKSYFCKECAYFSNNPLSVLCHIKRFIKDASKYGLKTNGKFVKKVRYHRLSTLKKHNKEFTIESPNVETNGTCPYCQKSVGPKILKHIKLMQNLERRKLFRDADSDTEYEINSSDTDQE